MRITGIELFKVQPRWLFLKIDTDEGISGWGEPVVEGRAETLKASVIELEDFLAGKILGALGSLASNVSGGFYRGSDLN